MVANDASLVARVWKSALRTLAMLMLAAYVIWNAFWLSKAQIPPSLIKGLTGFPAPTTGGTRSLHCLCQGELVESLRYNAMAVPICVLLAISLGQVVRQGMKRQRLSMPNWTAWSWLVVLTVAWVLKLSGDPGYW